jgi:hypothetical protein
LGAAYAASIEMNENDRPKNRNYFPLFFVVLLAALLISRPTGRHTPDLSVQAKQISKIAPAQMTANGLEVSLSGDPAQVEKLGKTLSKYPKDRMRIEAPPNNIQSAYGVEHSLFEQGVSSEKLDVAGVASRNSVVVVIQS